MEEGTILLGINRSLEKDAEKLYTRYKSLENRLLTKEYEHWAASFPGGNNHGPSHIRRVLEYLDSLLGGKPLELVKPYELFLMMMSILYHDIGILRERRGHADVSALFVLEEKNEYILDQHEKELVSAVVASHSGAKDIETECAKFSEVEVIGGINVRPYVIAALVRFADKLDEDYRRADPILMQRLNIPQESQFYWQFCQRIQGIKPLLPLHQININVNLDSSDVGSIVRVEGKDRSFISEFAEKLTKINRERVYVNKFIPEELRYHSIIVSVRPLKNHKTWKRPRKFVFNDFTLASDFVSMFPELLIEPATKWMRKALEFIRTDELRKGNVLLQRLEKIGADLPEDMHLIILYDRACIESLCAEKLPLDSIERNKTLDHAVQYIKKWLTLGLDGTWQKIGKTPQNELHRMGCDSDLLCALSERRDLIVKTIPKDLRLALPKDLPRKVTSGGGCVPAGTVIQTLGGPILVENLREGAQILSLDPEGQPSVIVAKVNQVHTSREPKCIRLNRRYVFTPAQPLYGDLGGWIRAIDLSPGMQVLEWELKYLPITQVEQIEGYFEVFNLTTNHPIHNYVANELVCHNKLYF